jgi:hypothetical protein
VEKEKALFSPYPLLFIYPKSHFPVKIGYFDFQILAKDLFLEPNLFPLFAAQPSIPLSPSSQASYLNPTALTKKTDSQENQESYLKPTALTKKTESQQNQGPYLKSMALTKKNRPSGKSGILSETNGVDQKNRIPEKSGLLSETNGVDQKNKLTRSVTHSSSKPTREISQESSKKVVKKKSTNKRKRLHDRVKSEILLTNQPKKDVSKQFSQCWNQLEALASLYEKENERND